MGESLKAAEPAQANIGLPMLAVLWPIALPAFLPVVAVETLVIMLILKIPFRLAVTQIVKANIVSTIVGIPLAWIVAFAIEIIVSLVAAKTGIAEAFSMTAVGKILGVIITAPWLVPSHTQSLHTWIIQTATIVLLVPFFFASFWIEAKVVSRTLLPDEPERVRHAIWTANLVSYIGLLIACIFWLILGLRHGR